MDSRPGRSYKLTMHYETKRIPFGNGNLFVRSVGKGSPILFIHGWPLNGLSWRGVAERLADRWRCHLVDLPGSGESDHDDATDFSARGFTRAVRATIDGLRLDRVALAAFDSGGTFARMAAAEDPRVTALVLGNTEVPNHRPPLIELFQKILKLPGSTAIFRTLLRSRTFGRSNMGYGGCFVDRSLIDGEFHDLFVKPLIESRRALAGQFGLLHHFDWKAVDALAEVHKKIDVPVKLIWGARDGFFPVKLAKPMADSFKHPAELAVIDGAKLLVQEEKPEEFAAEMAVFLKRVESSELRVESGQRSGSGL